MKRRSLLSSAAGVGAGVLGASEADAVRAAVRNCYLAYSAGDAQTYAALVTDDYVLLEHGEAMTLQDDLRSMPKPNAVKRTDAIEFLATRVVGDIAYTHWKLTATIANEKGATEKRWLESGVLRRSKGAWKIALLHSTRIEKK